MAQQLECMAQEDSALTASLIQPIQRRLLAEACVAPTHNTVTKCYHTASELCSVE